MWAYSESSLVDGDFVAAPPAARSNMVALDKKKARSSGVPRPRRPTRAGYASIIIVRVRRHQQYVQFMSRASSASRPRPAIPGRYDKTGASPANIPTPVCPQASLQQQRQRRLGARELKADMQVTAEEVYFKKGLPVAIGGSC